MMVWCYEYFMLCVLAWCGTHAVSFQLMQVFRDAFLCDEVYLGCDFR